MKQKKEGNWSDRNTLPYEQTSEHSKSKPNEHKRKRRRKRPEVVGSKTRNDNDILVENDDLVCRTDGVSGRANRSSAIFDENMIPVRNGLDVNYRKKPYFPKDVRKLALTLAVSKMAKPRAKENLTTLDHIDYVLVFSDDQKHKQLSNCVLNELRENFEEKVRFEGVSVVRRKRGNATYVVMSCSFERLCKEAEAVSLKMPLAGVGIS